MTFQNLPPDFENLPLTNDRFVADVLDLLIGDKDRRDGCLLIAMCDSQSRLVQPCLITDVPERPEVDVIKSAMEVIVGATVGIDPEGAVLVALGRPSGLSVTKDDYEWVKAVEESCHNRVRLLGVHVVTAEGSRPVPMAS